MWYHDWIALEKLPQKDSLNVQIHPQDQKILWYLYWSQLIYTFTADLIKLLDWQWKPSPKWPFECPILSTGSKDTVTFILKSADLYSHSWFDLILDWPWKTTPKWLIECPNPSTGSKDKVIFILKSADLYSHSWFDLTFGLALKNYPKMTHWMSKSVHWFKRYGDIYIEVSWFVHSQLIWSNYWIGLEKLPQNDPLDVEIRPLVQKIQWYLYWSQLICTVTADLI